MSPTPALRSVLVTGAAGFIGSTLVRRLLQDGTQVVGLDSLERGHADALPPQVPLIVGDVRDPDAVRTALQHFGRPPVACIHLASLILVGESVEQPERYHNVNAVGTQVVTDACLDAGVGAIVLASSAAVLGSEQGGAERLDETARIFGAHGCAAAVVCRRRGRGLPCVRAIGAWFQSVSLRSVSAGCAGGVQLQSAGPVHEL